jgi:hypothetical protein
MGNESPTRNHAPLPTTFSKKLKKNKTTKNKKEVVTTKKSIRKFIFLMVHDRKSPYTYCRVHCVFSTQIRIEMDVGWKSSVPK